MYRREERAVEPAAALADKLRERFWDVRLCNGALDVLENPVRNECVSFCTSQMMGATCQLEFRFATSSKHRIRCNKRH